MKEEDIRPAALLDEFFRLLKGDAERLARKRSAFVTVPCGFCGADIPQPAFVKDGYDYRLCGECGSMYVSPRPSAGDLEGYAESSDAVRFWSTNFYRETADARREKMFRPRAALVAELVRSGGARAGRLADIGSGYGLFLQEVAALGLFTELAGIEPDSRLATICREQGFRVIERWVEAIEDGEVDADVATCFEVIEHAFDPLAFLVGCRRTMRAGGLLLLTTLTIGGFDLQVLWERSRSITPPQHINFPSLEGARRLVERAGLELVELTTPGELDVDIVRNAMVSAPHLEVPRFVRELAQTAESTRTELQSFLRRNRLSSHLRLVARRQ